MNDARDLVERLATGLQPLETGAARAWWDAAVTGDPAAYRKVEAFRNRIDGLYAEPGVFDALCRAREAVLDDPALARRIELLYLEALPRQVDPRLSRNINRLAAEAEREFATFRPVFQGRRVSANDLDRVLREDGDEAGRREAWEALKRVGPVVADRLHELVVLRNRAAHRVGFQDFYMMRLALQEQDAGRLDRLLTVLDERSGAAYRETKRSIDDALADRYGRPAGELQPWHYADQFFQDVPDVFGADLDEVYSTVDPTALAGRFFEGIGLPVDAVLARSSLHEAEGKDPHAFATDIDRQGDVRILLNLRSNERWMGTTLHELGHAVYDLGIDPALPWDLRRPAHTLVTEAIAMLFGRLSRSPAWMRDLGVVDDAGAARLDGPTAAEARATMQVVVRWILVMAHFERRLYADPDQDLNALWWELVERFQEIPRPERPPGAADYAAKIHVVVAPVYYHNYLLGECLASQIDGRLRDDVLDGAASYAGRPEVGAWLRERIFRPGAGLHYDDLAAAATGSPVGPEAFILQFLEPPPPP
ncbi:MAG TPA: M2 family metallopeptidase [Gemmatimonadota bacterium]|nr:M2 family metallopeptidase [Gemmatimonadota bacterium]